MSLVKEVEKVISELPPEKAFILRFWLNEYKAARRYRKLKAHSQATKTLANFHQSVSKAMWN